MAVIVTVAFSSSVAAIAQGLNPPSSSSPDIRLPGKFCTPRSSRPTECHDRTNILFALVRNDIKEAVRLLEQTSYDSLTINSVTLGFAMLLGRPEAVLFVLNSPRLDPNVPTMLKAEIFDRVDLSSRLIEHLRRTAMNLGIDVDDPDLSIPPLHLAVLLNRPDFFHFVLKHPETRADQTDKAGNTIWHLIARYQRVDFARMLLSMQSNLPNRPRIDVRNKAGFTAVDLLNDEEAKRSDIVASERKQFLRMMDEMASNPSWSSLPFHRTTSDRPRADVATAVLGRVLIDSYSGSNPAAIPPSSSSAPPPQRR